MMRVMVVEDEEMIRKGIVMAVDWAALDCIVVGEAANGEQALAVAEDCQPTLIITDLKMPKMDGLEMVRRLREAGSRAYVIILTAYDSFAYAQTAIRLGAVDFLLKPFMTAIWKTPFWRCKSASPHKPHRSQSRFPA